MVEMVFHVGERQREDRLQRGLWCGCLEQVIRLEMTDRSLRFPANEQQRRPEAAVRVGLLVHERRHGVGVAVRASERGGASVHRLIATQGIVGAQRRRNDSFTTLPRMNARFAGRSARRRIRYGYQWVPKGTYTRRL